MAGAVTAPGLIFAAVTAFFASFADVTVPGFSLWPLIRPAA